MSLRNSQPSLLLLSDGAKQARGLEAGLRLGGTQVEGAMSLPHFYPQKGHFILCHFQGFCIYKKML